MATRVKALYVYPVKSCKGIQIDAATICPTGKNTTFFFSSGRKPQQTGIRVPGFQWDRQWLIVKENGRLLTQRVEPKLALIQPVLSPDSDSLSLTAPGMEDTLKVPLSGNEAKEKVTVSVWNWSGVALDEGEAAQAWLSKYLGKTYHLARFDPAVIRPTDARYADGYKSSFADGFPFLVVSQTSLDALNSRLEQHISINRFRPNIVVEGCEAFAEDSWETFHVGELTFHGVKLCSRCKLPNVNQETGIMGSQPGIALNEFRKGEMLTDEKSAKNQVYFGLNAVCDESTKACESREEFTVRVGDLVQVDKIMQKLPV